VEEKTSNRCSQWGEEATRKKTRGKGKESDEQRIQGASEEYQAEGQRLKRDIRRGFNAMMEYSLDGDDAALPVMRRGVRS
jgi:hypothetical protein